MYHTKLLAALLATIASSTSVYAVECFNDGQPFDEQWDPARIDSACDDMKGSFAAGLRKHQCRRMGDDHVDMYVKNPNSHAVDLTKATCKQGMHDIIDACGGFGSGNHGGIKRGSAWNFEFDPNEGGC